MLGDSGGHFVGGFCLSKILSGYAPNLPRNKCLARYQFGNSHPDGKLDARLTVQAAKTPPATKRDQARRERDQTWRDQ